MLRWKQFCCICLNKIKFGCLHASFAGAQKKLGKCWIENNELCSILKTQNKEATISFDLIILTC